MFPKLTLWREELQPPKSSEIESDTNMKTNESEDVLNNRVPEAVTNLALVESLIAKQMMGLSVEDREKTYMDVHGIKEPNIESDYNVEAGLKALDAELQKIQDKSAYDLARSMDSSYVENREFCLAFLRADNYDPAMAAQRIVRHFQAKMDLFGKEKLVMDIVQDDLDAEAMNSLYSGKGQNTNARDRTGRAIFLIAAGTSHVIKAMLQRIFYNGMVTARDRHVQLHGVVVVVCAFGDASGLRGKGAQWFVSRMTNSVPLRIEATHICHDSIVKQALIAVAKAAFAPFVKIRTRVHYGTHAEALSSLASYGIAPDDIPISPEGDITNLKSYQERMRKRRAEERLTQPRRNRIYVPSNEDVLYGKGTPSLTHPGNEKFRALITDWHKAYEKTGKVGKIQIAKDILNAVHQRSGLFLRKDGDSWVCVEDDAARQKISAAFRTYRRLGGWKPS